MAEAIKVGKGHWGAGQAAGTQRGGGDDLPATLRLLLPPLLLSLANVGGGGELQSHTCSTPFAGCGEQLNEELGSVRDSSSGMKFLPSLAELRSLHISFL